MSDKIMHKRVMEILAEAITVGASAAGLGEYLRERCYYHSDLINRGFYSAENIIARMDWVYENQSERCKCKVVALKDILQSEIKLEAFDRYEDVSPCEYALLLYEGKCNLPSAVVVTMIDTSSKLASIVTCRNKELFDVNLEADSSDAKRKRPTNPFQIYGQHGICGKTVFLDQYPIKEVTNQCRNYMQSLDWAAIRAEVKENIVSYFNISASMDLFPHLQLDKDYDLFCYITSEYHGLWGRVAAIRNGASLNPTIIEERGLFLGPEFDLPEEAASPMEAIYNDGTPEGYFEALIAEEFFHGLPYVFKQRHWDNCIPEHPEDYEQNWRVNIDIPDWRPRVCFNDMDDFYLYSVWRKFEHGYGCSDGKDKIYLRKHWFQSKLFKEPESGMHKSRIVDNNRFTLSKRCCESNSKEILIARQKRSTYE